MNGITVQSYVDNTLGASGDQLSFLNKVILSYTDIRLWRVAEKDLLLFQQLEEAQNYLCSLFGIIKKNEKSEDFFG